MADVSKIKLPSGTTYNIKDDNALPLTGGSVTGPVSFGDSVSIDEATIGDLVVNGSASFTNNLQANTINGVTVGSSPKFTDTNTVTTATTTGSGNAVTAVTASNGALTITKGTTFLTSHQDISGKADKATTLAGYGITDAKIASGVITLGSNTITPLTSSSTLSAAKLSGAIPSAVTATTQASTDNSTKIATTAYVTTAIANLPEPMVFKGSVGTGGTITSLPTAAAANEGHTYKVITALSSPSAKVGDTVISNGSEWIVIPSGDEPSGTVTSVGVSNATNGGLTVSGSPITSSGTVTIGHSNVLSSAQTTQAVYPIKIDKNGHISAYGSAVTIPTVPSNIVNTITTTAGAHTAISNQKGNVSFNVPTKTSHLTNDSGFLTSHLTGTGAISVENGGIKIIASTAMTGGTEQYVSLITNHTVQGISGFLVLCDDGSGDGMMKFFPDMEGVSAASQAIINQIPTKTSDLTNDSGFITSYTETDPVFNASAAAGITSTDITHWNSKSTATNWVNGGSVDSVRMVGSAEEDSLYTIGPYAVAEGYNTKADGYVSHAEGHTSIASGVSSHAEGGWTQALGNYSHASGQNTVAVGLGQTVIGTGNIIDTSDDQWTKGQYAFIIGNGSAENNNANRSNALTVDWSGNINIASGAKYKINGAALSAADVGAVPTTRTVNNKALSSDIALSASDVGAQATLVSGSNIKTINDISLLGSGDVWEALFNIVHPIYSFFETTDATFDPNTATGWYGTWELETEGLVHIGAGSTYTVGNTGGNKDAIIPYHRHSYTAPPSATDSHTLTASQIPAHTHGSESLIGYMNVRKWNETGHTVTSASGIASMKDSTGTGYPNAPLTSSTPKLDLITINATHEHNSVGGGKGHTHTITGSSSNTGYAGTSGNVTNANMQPYVVVNRWYRTA